MSKPKENKLESMPFLTRSWLSSPTVIRMRPAARGIYIHLLAIHWDCGFLPADIKELKRISNADTKDWKQFEPFLDTVFPQKDDQRLNEKLHEKRVECEAKYTAICERNRFNGSKNGVNFDTQTEPSGSKNDSKNSVENGPKKALKEKREKKSISKEIQNPKPQGDYACFDDFVKELANVYPGNNGRKIPNAVQEKLKKVWGSIGAEIIEGAKRYSAHREFLQKSKRFCPEVKMVQTWVNQQCWADEYETGIPVTAPTGNPVEGVDYELGTDEKGNFVRVIPGTKTPFDQARAA